MSLDNLRHAQYDGTGTQIDAPQNIERSLQGNAAEQVRIDTKTHYVLSQSGVPTVLLSSASNISTTGAITGLTALPYTPFGVVRVYCFAQAGLVAGLYFATFSSTTACQLFLDAAATITPAGITAGAYTGGTTQAILATVTIPGKSMGSNGMLRHRSDWSMNTTANSKIAEHRLGVIGISGSTLSASGAAGYGVSRVIRNKGVENRNVWMGSNSIFPAEGGISAVQSSINTAVDQLFTFNGTLSVATDYMILEGHTIEVLPS